MASLASITTGRTSSSRYSGTYFFSLGVSHIWVSWFVSWFTTRRVLSISRAFRAFSTRFAALSFARCTVAATLSFCFLANRSATSFRSMAFAVIWR